MENYPHLIASSGKRIAGYPIRFLQAIEKVESQFVTDKHTANIYRHSGILEAKTLYFCIQAFAFCN